MQIIGIEIISQFKRREDNVIISLLKIHVGYKRIYPRYNFYRALDIKLFRYHATYGELSIARIRQEYCPDYRFGTLRNEMKRYRKMCATPVKFTSSSE